MQNPINLVVVDLLMQNAINLIGWLVILNTINLEGVVSKL